MLQPLLAAFKQTHAPIRRPAVLVSGSPPFSRVAGHRSSNHSIKIAFVDAHRAVLMPCAATPPAGQIEAARRDLSPHQQLLRAGPAAAVTQVTQVERSSVRSASADLGRQARGTASLSGIHQNTGAGVETNTSSNMRTDDATTRSTSGEVLDEFWREGDGEASTSGTAVFVMMPLDCVNQEGNFRYAASKWFHRALHDLASSGVKGVAVDVWWGAVERHPKRYDWSGYKHLFETVKSLGLKVQVVLSFHACGGNIGDSAQVPLPKWVLKCGEGDPDLFFTDRPRGGAAGQRNREYISIFADNAPTLRGRTPMQCYADLMRAFRDAFQAELGTLIEDVVIGSGPCGELRYPSYVEANGWRFPGVGEFQCYDRRALASLAAAAEAARRPEWGLAGPHDSGSYSSGPEDNTFFRNWGGSWDTDYGRFFLDWYSGALLQHGDDLLSTATSIFACSQPKPPRVSPSADSFASAATAAGDELSALRRQPGQQGQGLLRGAAGDAPGRPMRASSSLASIRDVEDGSSDGDSDEAAPAQPFSQRSSTELSHMSLGSSASDNVYEARGGQGMTPSRSAEMVDAIAEDRPMVQGPGRALQWNRLVNSASVLSLASDEGMASPSDGQPLGTSRRALLPLLTGACLLGGWQEGPSTGRSSLSSASPRTPQPATPRPDSPAGGPVQITLKIAGIHWWYRTRSHAAELTAGYYNAGGRDGYAPIVELCARHGAALTLTCVEMCDRQHPYEALCGPEGLLRQVREAAAKANVVLCGENALPCFHPSGVDAVALDRIVYNSQPWAPPLQQDANTDRPTSPPASDAANPSKPPGASAAASAPRPAEQQQRPAMARAGSEGLAESPPAPASLPDVLARAASEGTALEERHINRFGTDPRYASLPAVMLPRLRTLTFLRLIPEMSTAAGMGPWGRFMAAMLAPNPAPSPVPQPHLGLRAYSSAPDLLAGSRRVVTGSTAVAAPPSPMVPPPLPPTPLPPGAFPSLPPQALLQVSYPGLPGVQVMPSSRPVPPLPPTYFGGGGVRRASRPPMLPVGGAAFEQAWEIPPNGIVG